MSDMFGDPLLVGHVAHAPILECSPATTLFEAVEKMQQGRRGSILVVENDAAVGIWTVDDLIRLDLSDAEVLARPIAEVMSSPVRTIRRDAALREASFRFRNERMRHLLVVDEAGTRVGIVSQTDVINNQGIEFFVHLRDVRSAMHTKFVLVPAEMPAATAIGQLRESRQDALIVERAGERGVFTATDVLATVFERAWQTPIGELAHYPLQSVSPDASLFQARTVFVERRIRHLGVEDGGRLIGLLTYGDIMACVEQVYLREMHQTVSDHSERLLLSQHALALARAVAESTRSGVVITDATGTVRSVNSTFSAITGYSPDEVIGKNMRILNSGRHDAEFFRRMFAALAEHGTWSGEIWNQRKDGELYLGLVSITAVRGIDGAIGNYVGVFSNITDQAREQEVLAAWPMVTEQESLYRIILDTLPVKVVVKDDEQRYVLANDRAADFIGQPKDQIRGRTDYDLYPAATAERLRDTEAPILAGLQHTVVEEKVSLRGAEFTLLSHKRGVELGGRRLLIATSMDISSRRLAEQRLADERKVLELIAANAELPLILDTICRNIERYLHGGFAAILTLDEDGCHLRHGAAPNLSADFLAATDGPEVGLDGSVCGAAAHQGEPVIVADIAAETRWPSFRDLVLQHSLRACWATPMFSSERQVMGTVTLFYRSPRRPGELDLDVIEQSARVAAIAIERARASAQLHRLATVDTLTGLPNRRQFFELGRRELARARRGDQPLAVCMADVDHFKRINDTHGHSAGDSVLRVLAARMAASLRSADICGRLGGEEFALVLPETDAELALKVAERLRTLVAEPAIDIGDGKACPVTVSIGIACRQGDEDLDRLLSRADVALYAAKSGGRNRVSLG